LAPETSENRLPRGWLVMAVLVVGVVAYGAYHLARSADRMSVQPVAPVPARIASPETGTHKSGPNKHLVVSARTIHEPASAPNAEAISPSQHQARGNVPGSAIIINGPTGAIQPSAKTPEVQSTVLPAKEAASADGKGPQGATLPNGQEFGARNARVVLHVRGLTRILVEGADGKVFINRILHPGDIYRVPNLVGLSLTTPDGGAVALELDGKDAGAAGRSGEMTEALSLDPQAIVNRTGSRNPG
jgi:cytoskeleton protein RodZ